MASYFLGIGIVTIVSLYRASESNKIAKSNARDGFSERSALRFDEQGHSALKRAEVLRWLILDREAMTAAEATVNGQASQSGSVQALSAPRLQSESKMLWPWTRSRLTPAFRCFIIQPLSNGVAAGV